MCRINPKVKSLNRPHLKGFISSLYLPVCVCVCVCVCAGVCVCLTDAVVKLEA